MYLIKKRLNRRAVLRGMVGGVGVTVGLPLLDCFLNDSGTALASGAQLPVRFGTWFWGMGMDKAAFIPKKIGPDYDLPAEIAAWKDVKQHINLFTNFNVVTDGKPSLAHETGWVACLTGTVPATSGSVVAPTIDVLVGDSIAGSTRFSSLACAATGSVKDSYSMRSSDAINPPEISPIDLYGKIFGGDFQDPNSPDFKPKSSIMMKNSVLTGVREQSRGLLKKVGVADRERLDQYFTSLRELEQRLEQQTRKPPEAPSCKVPPSPEELKIAGTDIDVVDLRHKAMTDLLVMALACNQSHVFSMVYSNAVTGLSKTGLEKVHHTITHEEPVDEALGYQPTSFMFLTRAFESYAYFVKALNAIPEGAGTLLDNTLVCACSDSEYARVHSINGIPMMTAGKAGGRLKTGYHVDGKGEVSSRVGFTLLKAMGVSMAEWGTGSMKTARAITEILA